MIFAGKTVTGKGVRIAIVDTGIDSSVPNLVDNWDVFLSSAGKIVSKRRQRNFLGRGTQLARLVLEEAPDVALIGINIFNEQAKTNSDILAAGIQVALEQYVDVICVCVSTNNPEKLKRFQNLYKQAEYRDLIIVSAHSISEDRSYPSTISGVVGVLSLSEIKSRFFYCDPELFKAEEYAESGFFLANGWLDGRFRGAEFATARVAAKIACLKEARPELWAAEIIKRLSLRAFLPVDGMSGLIVKKSLET